MLKSTYERFDPVTQQIIPGAEVGIDEGGLLRQWMSTASEALLGNQGLRSDASGAFSLPGGGCGGAASQGKGKELVQAAQALMSSLGVPVDASEDLQDQETRCLLKLTGKDAAAAEAHRKLTQPFYSDASNEPAARHPPRFQACTVRFRAASQLRPKLDVRPRCRAERTGPNALQIPSVDGIIDA